jgi:hypothetical protein
VVRVGKDNFLPEEKKEKSTWEEPINQRRKRASQKQTYLPKIQPEVSNDPAWLQRYRKATSREKIKIEDEAILDFLTHDRKRRGVIGRNPGMEVAAKPLDRLERILDKTLEKKRGRHGKDNKKFSLYLNPDFLIHLQDYSQKNGHNSMQDAVRWMIREVLRYNGYPVGKTLGE